MPPHLLGLRTSLQHQQECYGRREVPSSACLFPCTCTGWAEQFRYPSFNHGGKGFFHISLPGKGDLYSLKNILIYLAEAMELSMNHLTGFIHVQPYDLAVTNWTWWETALEADVTQLSQRLCYPVQREELNKQTGREKLIKIMKHLSMVKSHSYMPWARR